MQEPASMRKMGEFQLSQFFPLGIVISQEAKAPRRVQVRIPELHTDIPDADLPYYRVLMSNDISGHNGAAGRYSTLTPGTQVQVMLYDAQGYNGVVQGWLANTSNDIQGENLYGYRDEKGNSFAVDAEGTMTLTSAGGGVIKLTTDGSLDLVLKALNIHVGDFTISGDMLTMLLDTLNQTADTITISGSTVAITDGEGGGGGSASAPTLTPVEMPEAPDVADKVDM